MKHCNHIKDHNWRVEKTYFKNSPPEYTYLCDECGAAYDEDEYSLAMYEYDYEQAEQARIENEAFDLEHQS